MKKAAVYALTRQGIPLGKTIADAMKGELFVSRRFAEQTEGNVFDRFTEIVAQNLPRYQNHVFIAAAGIVVRAVAPHLKGKDRDPAVVVLDQEGKHVVSLLSGHLGGANQLAHQVAELTGGTAVITTATDTAGLPSIDVLAQERLLSIRNLDAVKVLNMAILGGDPIQLFDPEDRLGLIKNAPPGLPVQKIESEESWDADQPGVWVTWRSKEPESNQLVLHPRCLIAGVGCNRGTSKDEILYLIGVAFKENRLALQSLDRLATLDAKRDEPGLRDAAADVDVPLVFFKQTDLERVDVPNPSETVEKHMGVPSVCEAAALLQSKGGRLIVPKTKTRNVTLAVALQA